VKEKRRVIDAQIIQKEKDSREFIAENRFLKNARKSLKIAEKCSSSEMAENARFEPKSDY
jgi:hypothetical protein